MQRRCTSVVALLLVACLRSVCAVQFIPDTPSPFTSASKDDIKLVVTVADRVEANPADGQYVVMRDATGTPYRCQLPDGESRVAAVPQITEDEEPVRSPHDMLDSLEGMCLYRQDGLWTYEICYKQHVRQMHQSSKEEHSCGVYKESEEAAAVDDASAAGLPDDGVKIDRSTVGPALPYIAHTFVGGADCLLTRRPRTSEVRFTCMEEGGQNIVTSVREFPTCNYVFIVSTPFLCKHPRFRPQEEHVQAINCTLMTERDGASRTTAEAEVDAGFMQEDAGAFAGAEAAEGGAAAEERAGHAASGTAVAPEVVHQVDAGGFVDKLQQSFVEDEVDVETEAAGAAGQPLQDAEGGHEEL